MTPKTAICLLVMLVLSPLTGAATSLEAALANCQQKADPKRRLDCYDRVASGLNNTVRQGALASANDARADKSPALSSPQPATASMPTQNRPASMGQVSDRQVITDPGAPKQTGTFGLKKRPDEPERLASKIIGTFKGWKKGAILTLENGQRWKVLSGGRGYTKLVNPKVIISKGVFGSFNMRVEGLNAIAKVRRVK